MVNGSRYYRWKASALRQLCLSFLPFTHARWRPISCNFSRICYGTVCETFTLKDRKLLIEPTHPLFDAPAWGTP